MLRKSILLTAALAALTLTAGCDNDDVVTPTDGPDVTAAEMADVALQSDLITELVLNAELAVMSAAPAGSRSGEPAGSVTQDVTFSRSRSCPGGGEFRLEGEIHRTYDAATLVLEADSSGSRTRLDCVFSRGQDSVTVNGVAQWESSRRRVDGVPDGLQTSRYFGSTTAVRSDGVERSCEFDVRVVRDPETHTRTVEGTMCGTEVFRSVSWSFDE